MTENFFLNLRDTLHKVRLYIGFHIFGWHKPEGYDWGYFTGKRWLVRKRRDQYRIIHTDVCLVPENGVKYQF